MSYAALIGAGVSLVGGAVQANQAKKAAAKAGQASQVDIDALDKQTRRIALQNAQESAALEASMTPEVPQLRRDANTAVLNDLGTTNVDDYARGLYSRLAESPVAAGRTPLLQAAIAKAQADLAQGGRLSVDTQNAVTRNALARTGGVTGGLGLGRDVVARDLGLTAMQVENQRLQNASQLGGQELGMAGYNTDVAFNNRAGILNAVNALTAANNARFGRNLAAAQYGESIQRPVVGLDPTAVANLAVGNSNASGAAAANQANIAGQTSQNLFGLGGQLGTMALMNYNRSGTPTTPNNNYYNTTQRPNNNVVGFYG